MTEVKRDAWGHKVEFMLASIGWAVGYGNVWRFPYKCFEHGGGAFLIPYVICLVFAGVPSYALECCLGQFSRFGPNQAFAQLAPIFHGVGWAAIVVSVLVALYFNMLISWSLYYLYNSFTFDFNWSNCRKGYNTEYCFSDLEDAWCVEVNNYPVNSQWFNKSCHNASAIVEVIDGQPMNVSTIIDYYRKQSDQLKFPADEFFQYDLLQRSNSMDDTGSLLPHLVICQFIAWTLNYVCVFNGVKSTGKVVYFTATFPYLLITALLVRGVLLDGASDGIAFYLTPNWTVLTTADVWNDAAVQIFYTYGVAFGVVISFASYNGFHSHCLSDAYTICVTDSLTSFYTGFSVFSTAGFLAKKERFKTIVRDGSSLSFVVFAEAIARMPFPPLWAVIFFFMMVLVGIDSQFPMVEVFSTAIMDEFPMLRRRKPIVMAVCCIAGFLLGLPLCTNAGFYWFSLIENYSAGWSLLLLAALEVTVVTWVYGPRRFVADAEMMFGKRSKFIWAYWLFCWMCFTPIFLMAICISMLTQIKRMEINDKPLPDWAEALGWLMALSSVAMVPIFAMYQLIKRRKALKSGNWRVFIEPTERYYQGAEQDCEHKGNCANQPLRHCKPAPLPNSIEMTVNRVAPASGDVAPPKQVF